MAQPISGGSMREADLPGVGAIALLAFCWFAYRGPWLTSEDRQLITTWLKRLLSRFRPAVGASVSS